MNLFGLYSGSQIADMKSLCKIKIIFVDKLDKFIGLQSCKMGEVKNLLDSKSILFSLQYDAHKIVVFMHL